MKIIKTLLILKLIIFFGFAYSSQQKIDLEKDFRELSSELRCMVCQNQSLLDSDSDLANDLKEVVYEKLKEGQSKNEIKEYLVKRYGEFILFRPLFNISNFLLWLAPLLSFIIVAFLGFRKTIIKQKND